MRPVIGISLNEAPVQTIQNGLVMNNRYAITDSYIHAVVKAGGIPVVIPPTDLPAAESLERLDGLLLCGGMSLSPALYGEAPHPQAQLAPDWVDSFEYRLVREALRRDLPLLGICRGHQLLNVALGGSLEQHLPDRLPQPGQTLERHLAADGDELQFHPITVEADSRLAAMLGTTRLDVNSIHRQAVKRLGRGLRVVARADDQVIEAVEREGARFCVGVQWHPESRFFAPVDRRENPAQDALFAALVAAAATPAQALDAVGV